MGSRLCFVYRYGGKECVRIIVDEMTFVSDRQDLLSLINLYISRTMGSRWLCYSMREQVKLINTKLGIFPVSAQLVDLRDNKWAGPMISNCFAWLGKWRARKIYIEWPVSKVETRGWPQNDAGLRKKRWKKNIVWFRNSSRSLLFDLVALYVISYNRLVAVINKSKNCNRIELLLSCRVDEPMRWRFSMIVKHS
jgi:hypothetical protein